MLKLNYSFFFVKVGDSNYISLIWEKVVSKWLDEDLRGEWI